MISISPTKAVVHETIERREDLYFIGAVAAAFLIPLKLALTYIVLLPIVLYWVFRGGIQRPLLAPHFVLSPLLALSLWTPFAALFGLAPAQSILESTSFLFLLLVMLFFSDVSRGGRSMTILLSLCAGQTIAALHSIADASLPHVLPRFFLGQVTESGQLALVVPMTFGLLISSLRSSPLRVRFRSAILFGIILLVGIMIGFRTSIPLSPTGKLISVLALTSALMCSLWLHRSLMRRLSSHATLFLILGLPLLLTALLVNLKRGPWLGTTIALLVFLGCTSRRFIGPLLIGIVTVLIAVTPIRERLGQSSRDFFIAGGRSEIWDIGAELVGRFPLGIGIQNSPVLREYSTLVPSELTHFHNNFLNITVELGWIGLGLFLWFLVSLGRMIWTSQRKVLGSLDITKQNDPIIPLSIGCALLSWQIAGLVEYNVGDSEVSLAAFLIIGVACRLSANEKLDLPSQTESGLQARHPPESA